MRLVQLLLEKLPLHDAQQFNMNTKGTQPEVRRQSLTIETNPLHLLPSNIRRFSQADSLRHPAAPLLAKLAKQAQIPESDTSDKKDDEKPAAK